MAGQLVSAVSLAAAIACFTLTAGARASRSSADTTAHYEPHRTLDLGDVELAEMIRHPSKHEPEVFDKALHFISSLKSGPSCARFATATLLHSCQAVDSSTHDDNESPEVFLDQLRSTYAARLAVCELVEAGATVPAECSSLMSPYQPRQDKGFGRNFLRSKGVTEGSHDSRASHGTKALKHCLTSLESKPQWWTSYSNSRQNAVVICQAVRGQIERDELLDLHSSMTQMSSNLTETLSKALNMSTGHLARHKSLADYLQALQSKLQDEFTRAGQNAQAIFSKILADVELTAQKMTGKMHAASKEAETRYADLQSNIDRSNGAFDTAHRRIREVVQELVLGATELSSRQTEEWERGQEISTEVLAALHTIQEQSISGIASTLKSIDTQLKTSEEVLKLIQLKQRAIDERFVQLGTDFGELEDKVELFRTSQEQQLEVQTRLHELSEREMRVVLQFIEQVSSSAIRLQILVDETSSKINQMGSFRFFDSLLTTLSKWVALAVALMTLGTVRKATAALLVVGAGLAYTVFMINWSAFANNVVFASHATSVLETTNSNTAGLGESLLLTPELAATLKVWAMPSSIALIFVAIIVALRRRLRSSSMNGPTLPRVTPDAASGSKDRTWTPERQLQLAD